MDHPRIAALRKCIEEIRSHLDRMQACLDDTQGRVDQNTQEGVQVIADNCGTSVEGVTDGIFWRVEVGVNEPTGVWVPGAVISGPLHSTEPQ